MNKTKIPWADYTINPVKGLCPMACPYCYARRMYKRFKWNPEIRYNSLEWYKVSKIRQPSRIFVGSTIELFGDWIDEIWFQSILGFTLIYPQHTFIFLTKQPQNLIKFSPFPDNCWVGVTATDRNRALKASQYLRDIKAKVKFLSIEPLLDWVLNTSIGFMCELDDAGINWIILGAQTKPTVYPKIEWVQEIVEAANKEGIPIFLKDNIESIMGGYPIPKANIWAYRFERGALKLRQEMPK